MNKTRLQELCHSRHWDLPRYTTAREGPDHAPSFRATVTVNSVVCASPDPSCSARGAQDKAAWAAIQQLSSTPARPPAAQVTAVAIEPLSREARPPDAQVALVPLSPAVRPPVALVALVPLSSAARSPAALLAVDRSLAAMVTTKQLSSTAPPPTLIVREQFSSVAKPPPKIALEPLAPDVGHEHLSAEAPPPAQFATLEQLSSAASPPNSAPPLHLSFGDRASYKNRLQNYLQRRSKNFPTYHSIQDGPSTRRFRATVKADGRTFESERHFPTVKEAEQSAAEVALMSLSPEGNQQEYPGFFKNLLQQLAQEEGTPLPKYTTTCCGESHSLRFSSLVEIKGKHFQGEIAKTKKQAEMNAAQVALSHLKEPRSSISPFNPFSKWQVQIVSEHDLSSLMPMQNDVFFPSSSSSQMSDFSTTEMDDFIADDHALAFRSSEPFSEHKTTNQLNKIINIDNSYHHSVIPMDKHDPDITVNKNDTVIPTQKPETVNVLNKEDILQDAISEDDSSVDSSDSDCFNLDNKTAPADLSTSIRDPLLFCKRVQIYPRKSGLVLPEGAVALPCSDGNWVAVKVDF